MQPPPESPRTGSLFLCADDALVEEVERAHELAQCGGLVEHDAVHLLEEGLDLRVALVTGDEDETRAEVRLHPLDRRVKHVPGHMRHHHVANDRIHLVSHDELERLNAVGRGVDDVALRAKQFLIHHRQLDVVIDDHDGADAASVWINCVGHDACVVIETKPRVQPQFKTGLPEDAIRSPKEPRTNALEQEIRQPDNQLREHLGTSLP